MICKGVIGATVNIALAKVWNSKWILVSVFLPAIQTVQFKGTFDSFVVDGWIVPIQTQKVVASGFQSRTVERTALAILVWILAVDHPKAASRKASILIGFAEWTHMGK